LQPGQVTGDLLHYTAVARVVLSSPLPIDVGPLLPGHGVEGGARRLSRDELLAAVAGADALVCLLSDRVDEELLARAPRLRVVANYAVGVDNIDLEAARRHGVAVTNTPDVLTEATADLAFALLLAAARRVGEGERLARSGEWRGWEPGQLLGAEVHGRTLGIVGLGRIGAAVARRAAGFSMRVLHASPRPVAGTERVPLDDLLRESDFVSIHCRLDATTRGLIGARELGLMKPTAVLVNTARGAIVDEEALAAALAAGRLAGAGLDVYADEPRIPRALRAEPRAILLPHLGSATHAARARMAELCALGVREVLAGRTPHNLVAPT
jgi:glyoxylate reductase